MDKILIKRCGIRKETDKAYLIITRSKCLYWIPKSVSKITEITEEELQNERSYGGFLYPCYIEAPKWAFTKVKWKK